MKVKYFLSLFFILLFSIHVFADGMPIRPDDYFLADIVQDSQIVYIDFDGSGYTTSLYISFDFSTYTNDQLIWIVPFEELPSDIEFEEATISRFKREFSEFDDQVDTARELKTAYEEGLPGSFLNATIWHYLPFPLLDLWLILSLLLGGTIGAFGRSEMLAPGSDLVLGNAEPEAIAEFDFGALGRADVYKLSDGSTLQKFFQDKGVSVPGNLSSYLNRNIVVFSINRVSEKVEALAKFRFANNSKISFPSSTTQFWKQMPEEYIIKLRTPKDFRLTPNMEPNFEINDLTHRYMVFSPGCYGLAGWEYYDCLEYLYADYGGAPLEIDMPILPPPRPPSPLYNTDLTVDLQEEKQPIPVGMILVSFLPPLLIQVVLIFVAWLAALLIYITLKKIKLRPIEILLYSIAFPIFWTVLNLLFVVLFVIGMLCIGIVLALFVAVLLSLSSAMEVMVAPASAPGLLDQLPLLILSLIMQFTALFILLAIPAFIAIGIGIFVVLVIKTPKILFAWTKNRFNMVDLLIMLFISFIINILLMLITLGFLSIAI